MRAFGPTLVATHGKDLVSKSTPVNFTTSLGAHHRKQRKLLNPLFNVNHMRYMTPIFHRVARKVLSNLACTKLWSQSSQLRGNLESIVSDSPQEINIADWMGRFALELIGQAGLGHSFGTFEDRNDEYC